MKNYQKDNCSGKALQFTGLQRAPGHSNWIAVHQFSSSNLAVHQFANLTRQRHPPRAPTLLFPAATQSLRPPDTNINFHVLTLMYIKSCHKLCPKLSCISTWAQTSIRLLPAGTTSEIRWRKSASRRPDVS